MPFSYRYWCNSGRGGMRCCGGGVPSASRNPLISLRDTQKIVLNIRSFSVYIYYTRIGSNKGKTPEHNQANIYIYAGTTGGAAPPPRVSVPAERCGAPRRSAAAHAVRAHRLRPPGGWSGLASAALVKGRAQRCRGQVWARPRQARGRSRLLRPARCCCCLLRCWGRRLRRRGRRGRARPDEAACSCLGPPSSASWSARTACMHTISQPMQKYDRPCFELDRIQWLPATLVPLCVQPTNTPYITKSFVYNAQIQSTMLGCELTNTAHYKV